MKKKIMFIIILFLIIGLLFLGFINYESKNKKHTLSFNYLDNDIIINIYNTKNTKILEQIKEIYKEYDHLIDKENKYDRVNNLYYILYNDSKEESIKIDKKLYKMIESGIEWYQKSDGLIDISKGSVADIWKMYRDSTTGVPTTFELKRADINNINDIELLKNTKIKNNHVSMELLDIAKGFATYEVTKLLEKNNIDEYLISIGSSTIVGKHYNNKKYEIAIENPINNEYEVLKGESISIINTNINQNYYEYNKKHYHDIINPKTLMPADNFAGVTVITNQIKDAFVLSKFIFLSSFENGKNLVKENKNLEVKWYIDENKIEETSNFNKYE